MCVCVCLCAVRIEFVCVCVCVCLCAFRIAWIIRRLVRGVIGFCSECITLHTCAHTRSNIRTGTHECDIFVCAYAHVCSAIHALVCVRMCVCAHTQMKPSACM